MSGRRRLPTTRATAGPLGRARRWVGTVTTSSTAPPPGLFTRDARTIARALASRRVSPAGPTSGLRMLLFFMNRAGRGLTDRRRRELLRAKRLLQETVVRRRRGAGPSG